MSYLATNVWPLVKGLHTVDDPVNLTGEKWAQDLLFLRSQAKAIADADQPEDWTSAGQAEPPDDAPALATKEYESNSKERKQVLQQERERNVLAINRQLLKAYYGNLIVDKSVVYSGTVLLKDQQTRLKCFWWSLLVFVIGGLCIDLNAASWHGFYRRRLGETWLEEVPGFGTHIPLAQLDTTAAGAPYQLISGCLQMFGKQRITEGGRRAHYLFSKLYCGSDRLAYKATYSYMGGNYMLEDAIAISGAAVTPGQSQNPLVVAMFFLLNMRLGQWLENPAAASGFGRHFGFLRYARVPLRLIGELLWPAEARSACFVSDGGHFENLGIDPLLQRRCRLIIAFDAGQDGNFEFSDFHRLAQRVRMTEGIRFECCSPQQTDLSLASLTPNKKTGRSRAHYVIGRIIYPDASPDDPPSWIVYAKSSLTGDEPQVLQRLSETSQFPHDPTSDQFYDATRFDAYRHLGQHIADDILLRLPDNFGERSRDMSPGQFIRALTGTAEKAVDKAAETQEADVPDSTESELAEWIKILEDPNADAFEHWFAAREIAKSHTITDRALKSLVACLFSKEPHLAAVGRRCLTEIGSPVLSLLNPELASNTQTRLLKVIELITAIIERTSTADDQTIDALSGRLKELSEKNSFEKSRMALVHVLGIAAELVVDEFSRGNAFGTLSHIASNDKSRSVRQFSERLVAELKTEG